MLGERCQVTIKLDDKGRIALPARLRRKLKEAGKNELVLTYFGEGIRGYLPEYFSEHIEGQFQSRDPFAAETLDLQVVFLGGTEDCSIDGQGRVRIPAPLREEAGLDGDCVLISALDWIDIWPLERWRERRRLAIEARKRRYSDGA